MFFSSFYKEIFLNWKKTSCYDNSNTFSHFVLISVWYNKSIQVENVFVHFLKFSQKKLLIMFCNSLATMISFKNGLNLRGNTTNTKGSYFQWVQLVESILERWKLTIKKLWKCYLSYHSWLSINQKLKSYLFR